MPTGVIINSLSIVIGGILGTLLSSKISDKYKDNITLVLGLCAMSMGINTIVLMENMPAVILAVILGTTIGIVLKIGKQINKFGLALQKLVAKLFPSLSGKGDSASMELLVTAIVLFCSSATGIYGSLDAGFSGNHSILITKSILDLCTALVFACKLGPVVSLIAIPQCMIFSAIFYLAQFIYPLTTAVMINDFKACGGILMLATGLGIAKIKSLPISEMIPAMVLVMPISYLWITLIG